ncbi:hypothetical protein [Candidatus Entotheonella palauensis]|uniref:Uncharacterized protein n=1 Tax=Candidatus Entotheonella gemina TaxID=1429439 RepID=W4MGZ0_9BACT|nr:hypothetical protein [Candidatus Entotheonella palauensis]ETX08967.1 MAG: hypothetical protein ETSY2_02215 [Candidatus Entotheonella gemina]
MRKTMTLLFALALLVGFSGFAMAGGDGFCAYSDKKVQAEAKTEKAQPVASKTDKADGKVALADAEKTQPAAKK